MADAGGGEGAGVGEAAPFPSRAFIPCRELPGNFPEWTRGAAPLWLLSTGGCVPLKEQGGERRAATAGTAAPSGSGAGKRGAASSRESSSVCWDPTLRKEGRVFCGGSPLAFRVQGAEPKRNLGSGTCLAAEPCATTHSYSVGVAPLSAPLFA